PVYAVMLPILESPLLSNFTTRLATHEAFASTLRSDGSGVSADKVHFAFGQVFASAWVAALPTALLAALIYLAASMLTAAAWQRVAVAFGYALLTPAFAYANAFYGHQLSAALLFGAFVLALWLPEEARETGLRTAARWGAIGALLAFAVVSEYPAALPGALIALYSVWRLYSGGDAPTAQRLRRLPALLWAALAGGGVLALWMWYNQTIFGAPLELGYRYSELWHDQHSAGFMSLGAPSADAFWGITFSPFRGLFLLAPWLLLALPGFALWFTRRIRRAEWALSLALVLVMFLFNGSSAMWWGGFAVGPRYLLPALPWLALPVALLLARWQGWPMRLLATLLALWSLAGVWGMTLAEQAFPPDSMLNPWRDHLLANWQAGNLARNAGTLLGLQSAPSLLPLLLLMATLVALWLWLARNAGATRAMSVGDAERPSPALGSPMPSSIPERPHAG
ncbi:MAG: hypothetical protein ACRC1H_03040, partial [Caldilineaceae bacterium]